MFVIHKRLILINLINSLVEGASDAIFVAEVATGLIVYVNPAACRLFECDQDYLIGKHQSQLHPVEELEEVLQKFVIFTTSDTYKETTAHIITRSGKKKLVLITGANMFELDKKMFASAYFKDISYVEKLREIAFDESHKVRRPLANILGLSKMLAEEDVLPEDERKQFLKELYSEAQVLDNEVRSISTKAQG